MTLPRVSQIVAIALLLAGLSGCKRQSALATKPSAPTAVTQPSLSRFEYAKIYMGVRTRLIVYATDETAAVNACRAAFDRVGQVEQVASDYRKDSELVRLGMTSTPQRVRLSDDLWTLLWESLRIAELSDGAFDPT